MAAFVNRAKEWIHVSCWHSGDSDSYAMWKIYGRSSEAVAVHTRSDRIKSLMAARCAHGPGRPMAVLSTVHYVQPIEGRMPKYDMETVCCASWGVLEDDDRIKWGNLMATCPAQKPTAYAYEQEMRLLFLDASAPGFWEITDVEPQAPAACVFLRATP